MITRKLRPATIIPPELYVERAADRQLRSVIQDMGRPGYILVARQMGKTNLLIHMKRELAKEIVLYLDLSSRFDSARAWFQHVINSFIDTYGDLFRHLEKEILDQRQTQDWEPNVEFDRHLRLLLRHCKNRIIIILDEIDSLINDSFSDVILAQIRSMYFSRINFSEYERLTYVLSGVAEPIDLIKDKNISPFNIGEKIYLEDFNLKEFEAFLEKASLSVDEEVVKAIYLWTNGNPRMTWDVCSDLEERILNGEHVTVDTVNNIVDKVYLRDFDRAPVDHIRILVEADSQLRDAIVSIRFKKSDFLDDKIKSRLYLSGITRSSATEGLLIKNKIIDEALPDKWLAQLTESPTSILKKGHESFAQERFEDAILTFERILSDPALSGYVSEKLHYELGLSYYYVDEIEQASEQFELCLSSFTSSENPSNVQLVEYFLALTLSAQNKFDEALPLFNKAIQGSEYSTRVMATLAKMQALLALDNEQLADEAINLGNDLIQELENKPAESTEEYAEFLVTAIYNVALCHAQIGNYDKAEQAYMRAINHSRAEWTVSIFHRLYEIENDPFKQKKLASQIAHTITEKKLSILSRKSDTLSLNKVRLTQGLFRLHKHQLDSEFDNLANYAASQIFSNEMSLAATLFHLYEAVSSEERRSVYVSMLERVLDVYYKDCDSTLLKLKLLRNLAIYTEDASIGAWRKRYVNELSLKENTEYVSEEDLSAIAAMAISLARNRKFNELTSILKFYSDFTERANREKTHWDIILVFCEMEASAYIGPKKAKAEIASRLLALLDSIDLSDSGSSEYHSILNHIRSAATQAIPLAPIKRSDLKKIGRNQKVKVKYEDSEIRECKYKHIEQDLKDGRCALVE